jgi:hypothetical protein
MEIDGTWVGGPYAAPGLYSDTGVRTAGRIEGRQLRIVGGVLLLPDKTSCLITLPRSETFQNDMATFGSGGGDWSRIGLVPTEPGFVVEVFDLACGGVQIEPNRLVWQASSSKLLVDVRDGVFVPLEGPARP